MSLSQVLDLFLRQRPVNGESGHFPGEVALRTRARQPELQSRGAVAAQNALGPLEKWLGDFP